MTDEEILALTRSIEVWYHRIELRPGIITPGFNDSPENLRLLGLPADCTGMRALDIGARDGYFSFELEKRGAEVTAVDYMPSTTTGFSIAAHLLGSKARYLQENIYNLSRKTLGEFDIVLFLGLLYHLPDPLGALRIVRTLCRGLMFLETLVIDGLVFLPDGRKAALQELHPALSELPLMQFFPGSSRNNDKTNFWGPNLKCVQDMLIESEFRILDSQLNVDRAIVRCATESDPEKLYQWRIATGAENPGAN